MISQISVPNFSHSDQLFSRALRCFSDGSRGAFLTFCPAFSHHLTIWPFTSLFCLASFCLCYPIALIVVLAQSLSKSFEQARQLRGMLGHFVLQQLIDKPAKWSHWHCLQALRRSIWAASVNRTRWGQNRSNSLFIFFGLAQKTQILPRGSATQSGQESVQRRVPLHMMSLCS